METPLLEGQETGRRSSTRKSIYTEDEDRERIRSLSVAKEGRPRTVSEAIRGAERYKTMDDHRIDLGKLYKRLNVNPENGLSSAEAVSRNQKHGDNRLTPKKTIPWYCKLAKEMVASFSLLLWVGAGLCFFAYYLDETDPSNAYLGFALIIVIVFTGCQNYYQNANADAIMESFKNFIPPRSKVLRDGAWASADATKLVPGDIVEIKAGDRIPADIRITYSQEMRVDNSSLTGESDPLLRSTECTSKENPLETANLAFFGTLCPEGIGRGIVIQIGDNTVIGQIANLASAAGAVISPLRREMDRFVVIIAFIAGGTGVLFFILGIIIGYPIMTDLVFGIGILCAYVPEGLVTCVVVALTLTAKKLATKKVLVKNLEAVETLGSASCICSDKTGTLTKNIMTVENLWFDGEIHKGDNWEKFNQIPSHKFEYDPKSIGFRTLHENAMLCSDAVFDNAVPQEKFARLERISDPQQKEVERQKIITDYQNQLRMKLWMDRPAIGDASETALIKFFQGIEDILATRQKNPIRKLNDGTVAKIPFNSAWKYALTICDYQTDDSENCIFIKGAPERIWTLCDSVSVNGKPVPIDETWQKRFDEANKHFGNGGQRVLGFAKLHLNKSEYPGDYQFTCKNPLDNNYPMEGFAFSGLISLVDPPRDAVPFSILKCKTAGVKVIMVTGDQPATAAAIARQVNIFEKHEKTVNQVAEEKKCTIEEAFEFSDSIVIHGDMITEASKADEKKPPEQKGKTVLRWLTKPRIVFARTTPAQKLIIVKACQEQGHTVAVTGDGVNDSPAIKKADIGIAMGITGSDVAKDAADMVLLTDDFSAIVIGIEEGRKIFDNLKRAIIYCLCANIAELTPFLALIIFGYPLPLSSVLVLCIDLGFNIFPAISFASEEAEIDIMVRPPRSKMDHLVTRKLLVTAYVTNGIFESFGGFLTYFVIMQDFGFKWTELANLGVEKGFMPNAEDQYDPALPYLGNTNPYLINYCNNCLNGVASCNPNNIVKNNNEEQQEEYVIPDWLYNTESSLDLRLLFVRCQNEDLQNPPVYSLIGSVGCNVKLISPISGQPVCYTPDALKYAQSGFYFTVALCQIFLIFALKTRRQSTIYSGLTNYSMHFGFFSIIMVVVIIAYLAPLNTGLNSRPVIFLHFGWPGVPFGVFMLMFDEIKKYLVRNVKPAPDKATNWFERNTVW